MTKQCERIIQLTVYLQQMPIDCCTTASSMSAPQSRRLCRHSPGMCPCPENRTLDHPVSLKRWCTHSHRERSEHSQHMIDCNRVSKTYSDERHQTPSAHFELDSNRICTALLSSSSYNAKAVQSITSLPMQTRLPQVVQVRGVKPHADHQLQLVRQ